MNNLVTVFESYLKKSGKSLHTQASYLQNAKNFFEYLQERPIEKISTADIEAYLEERKKEGIGNKTYNLIITSLRFFYKYYSEKDNIQNPTLTLLPIIIVPQSRASEDLTKRVDRFIDFVRKSKKIPLRDKAIILCMGYLSLSTTEVLSIELKNIKIEKNIITIKFFSVREKESVSLEIKQIWALRDFVRILHDYLAIRLAIKTTNQFLFITEKNSTIERFYFNKIFKRIKEYAHVTDIRSSDLRFSHYNIHIKKLISKAYPTEILFNRFKIEKKQDSHALFETYDAYDFELKQRVILKKYFLSKKKNITQELIRNILSLQTIVQDKKVVFPYVVHFVLPKHAYLIYTSTSTRAQFIVEEFLTSLFFNVHTDCVKNQWYIPVKETEPAVIPQKEIKMAYESVFSENESHHYFSEVGIIKANQSSEVIRFLYRCISKTQTKLVYYKKDSLEYPLYIEFLQKYSVPVEKKLVEDNSPSFDFKDLFTHFSKRSIEKMSNSLVLIHCNELHPDDERFFTIFFSVLREVLSKKILILWVTHNEETINFLMKHNAFLVGTVKNHPKHTVTIEKNDHKLFKIFVTYRRPFPLTSLMNIMESPVFLPRLFFYVREGLLVFSQEDNSMCVSIKDTVLIIPLLSYEKGELRKIHKRILFLVKQKNSREDSLKLLFHLTEAKRKKLAFKHFKDSINDLKAVGLASSILTYIESLKYLAAKAGDKEYLQELALFCYIFRNDYEKAIRLCLELREHSKETKKELNLYILLSRIYKLLLLMEQAALYLEKAEDLARKLDDKAKQEEIGRDLKGLMKIKKEKAQDIFLTSLEQDYATIMDFYNKGEHIITFDMISFFFEKHDAKIKRMSLQEQYRLIIDPRILNLFGIKNRLAKILHKEEPQKTSIDRVFSIMYSSLFFERIKNSSEKDSLWNILSEEILHQLSIGEVEVVLNNFGLLEKLYGTLSPEVLFIVKKLLYTRERFIYNDNYLAITTRLFKKEIIFVFPKGEPEQWLQCLRFIDLIEHFLEVSQIKLE